MTALTSAEIQRENLAQWRLGRFIALAYEMDDGAKAALVRVGMAALNRPRGGRAASAMPPDAIVEWQPEIETQEMAILRAEVQWRSAQGTATRERALCETAHFGQEQSG